jgi:hypothetical protein
LFLAARDAASQRTQDLVVALNLREAFGEPEEELGRSGPAPDPCQLDRRLLHLREARLALPRFHPRPASQEPSRSQVQRKPEPLGETHKFSSAFLRPVEFAALEVDDSSLNECGRQGEQKHEILRHFQRHPRHRPPGL